MVYVTGLILTILHYGKNSGRRADAECDLEGYLEYQQKVRYRIFPFLGRTIYSKYRIGISLNNFTFSVMESFRNGKNGGFKRINVKR